MVQLLRCYPGRVRDLVSIGERLPDQCLASEQTPPRRLQVQPAGAFRDTDLMHARMRRQPFLYRLAGMARQIVGDQRQITLRVGGVDGVQQPQIADGIARTRREGQFVPLTYTQRTINPDVLWPTTICKWCLDPMAITRPARAGWEGSGCNRPEFIHTQHRGTYGRVGIECDDRRPFGTTSGSVLVAHERGLRQRTPSARKTRRSWLCLT